MKNWSKCYCTDILLLIFSAADDEILVEMLEELENDQLNIVEVDEIPNEYSDNEDEDDDEVEWYTEDEEEVDPDDMEPDGNDGWVEKCKMIYKLSHIVSAILQNWNTWWFITSQKILL